jgi:hypothetical protein
MRNLGLRLLILLYWIIGRGPWIVVGQWYDDNGKMRRFIAGSGRSQYASLDKANDYCESRNDDSIYDPLGTTYYVWHELEWKLYQEDK